jgi:hypothetical protein
MQQIDKLISSRRLLALPNNRQLAAESPLTLYMMMVLHPPLLLHHAIHTC